MKILSSLVFLLISFNSADGCFPSLENPEPPLGYVISKTQTIYIGKVISKKTSFEKDENGRLYRVESMRLKVKRTLKGEDKEIREIAIGEPFPVVKHSCYTEPPKLKVGETWFIQKDFDAGSRSRPTVIGSSFRGYFKYNPKKDADYVKTLEKIIQNPTTAIYGQVAPSLAYPALENIVVSLEGNGISLSTKLIEAGEISLLRIGGKYSFENIPAGNYKIQIRFPTKSREIYPDRETIYNQQTKTFNFDYEATVKTGDSDFYYLRSKGL